MAVSKSEWAEMSWEQRINVALTTLNITQAELAKRLNVTPRTINYWKTYKKVPSPKYAKLLKTWCIQETFDDIKEESYMALHSLSADASARLLENACASRDNMMLAMAAHCVAIKLAAILEKNSKAPEHTVIHIKSLYGSIATSLVVTNATIDPITYSEVRISAPAQNTSVFTLVVTNVAAGIETTKFAFSVSDKALLLIAKRINAHLTLD